MKEIRKSIGRCVFAVEIVPAFGVVLAFGGGGAGVIIGCFAFSVEWGCRDG